MSEKHLNEDYKIIIKLRIFSKFTIIKIILTEKKLKRLNLQQEAKIIKTRIIENKSKIDKKIFKEYSKGMKMKLTLAVALSHHAKLLILDEATSGLDPIVRDEILDIFLEFIQDEEHTILISSHIISDLEKVSDYITFINKGEVLFSKEKDELIYNYGIVKCSKEEADRIDKDLIVGIRESNFGCEVMVNDKNRLNMINSNIVVDNCNIEEIMLFSTRYQEVR